MNVSFLFVFLGGGVGSVLRYWIGKEFNTTPGAAFPTGTLLVNLTGSLLIGLFWGIAEKSNQSTSPSQLLLITGFCGGFTTFSAFSQESLLLLKAGNWYLGFGYILITIVAGLLLTGAGYKLISSL